MATCTAEFFFHSQDASPSLSLISDTTGGLKYFTGDDDAALELQGALLATIQRDCSSGITTVGCYTFDTHEFVTQLSQSINQTHGLS